jgi:hypothetical protein
VRIRALGGNPAGRPPVSKPSRTCSKNGGPVIGVKMLNTLRFLVIFALMCGIALGLIQGLRSGKMHLRGRDVKRASEPIFYWFGAAMGCVAVVGLFALLVWFALNP